MLAKLMVLRCQILLCLVIVAVAESLAIVAVAESLAIAAVAESLAIVAVAESLAIAAVAEAILKRTSSEQSSLDRVAPSYLKGTPELFQRQDWRNF